MILLGGRPEGRNTEQHDIFFSIGPSVKDLIPGMKKFWPGVNLHIDAWRKVTSVDGYKITIEEKNTGTGNQKQDQLFFINLGGYQRGIFDELHFKMLTVQKTKALAVKKAKDTSFYKEADFSGARSHVDDHFGVDVDEVYKVADILPDAIKEKYTLNISKSETITDDQLHIGYFKLTSFME